MIVKPNPLFQQDYLGQLTSRKRVGTQIGTSRNIFKNNEING